MFSPVKIAIKDTRIGIPIIARYLGWLDGLQSAHFQDEKCPWVPVGVVGGIVIIGHCDYSQPHPFPRYAVQRVVLSEKDYGDVLENVRSRVEMAHNFRSELIIPASIPKELPQLSDDVSRLKFAAEHMVAERRIHSQISDWIKLPISTWGEGYKETVDFLAKKNAVIDVRYILSSLPEKYQDILSASGAVVIDCNEGLTEGTLVVVVSMNLDQLGFEDKLVQRARAVLNVRCIVSRDDWLRDLIMQGGGTSKSTSNKMIAAKGNQSDSKFDVDVDVDQILKEVNPRKKDVPAKKMFEWVLAFGYSGKSTDIHLEPYIYDNDAGRIRIRIDGDCVIAWDHVPTETMTMLTRHVKDKCHLNEVTFVPQDSAIAVRFQQKGLNRVIKLRVSAMPVKEGQAQSIVLRFLNFMTANLSALDMESEERKIIEWAIQRSHGVVYVTGPTGSGKTTTLYSCLSELNTPENTILTAEDPIEYELGGVRQSQIQNALDFKFSDALRSMLRQDPDIILVGEIRDPETAGMLLAAAETGHLCFTTLHTNSALAVLPRMETFGLKGGAFDRQKIVTSSILFHAQRLVKKVCPNCHEPVTLTDDEKKIFEREKIKYPERIVKGRGCSSCQNKGVVGRTAIMEMVPVYEGGEIYAAIDEGQSIAQIRRIAGKSGHHTLFQSALKKVASGIIPMKEAMIHNTFFTT